MKKRWKVAGLLTAIVGAICAGIVLLAPIAIERFSPSIAQALSRAVGHPVVFEKLAVRFFPSIGVSVHGLRVSGTNGAEASPAEVGELVLEISPFDLLGSEIGVKNIALHDVTLAVVRDQSGTVFLKGLRPKVAQKATTESAPEAVRNTQQQQKPPTSDNSVSLSVEQAIFERINIQFTDESVQPPRNLDMRGISGTFSLENQSGAQSFDLLLNGTNSAIVLDKILEKKTGTELALRLRGLFNNGGQSLTLEQGTLSLAGTTVSVAGETLPLATSKFQVRFSPLSLADLATLSPALRELGLSGTLNGKLLVTAPFDVQGIPILTGDVELKRVQVQKADAPAMEISEGTIQFRGRSISIPESTLIFPGGSAALHVNLPNLQNGEVTVESEGIDIGELLQRVNKPIPALTGSNLQKLHVNGKIETNVPRFVGEISFQNLGTTFGPVANFRWNGDANQNDVRLNPFQFRFADGQAEVSGKIGLKSSESALTIRATSMDLGALSRIGAGDSSVGLSGTLRSADAQVTFDRKKLKETLDGKVVVAAGPGSITGLNLLGEIVARLSETPLLGASLSRQLPPELQQLMKSKDTAFNEMRSNVRFVSGGQIFVDDFELTHSMYRLRGAGEIRPNGALEFRTRFAFTQPTTARLVGGSKNLRYALNGQGELEVPVRISMSGSNLLVVPDVERLLQNAARSGAVDAAGRALDKVAPGLGGASNVLKGLFK